MHRTDASDNIMASSARFSIATQQAAVADKPVSLFPVIVAVPAVVLVLIIAASVWFCWFRKRRRQIRSQSRSFPKVERKSSVPLNRQYQDPKSPVRDGKLDIEERGADDDLGEREPKQGQNEIERESQLPMPVPPPPAIPAEETAELPLFITPRASRQTFKSLRRARAAVELDTDPASPRPKSFDEVQVAGSRIQSLPAARRSKRYSLQQILHLRKAAELDGNENLPSHPCERRAQGDGSLENLACDPEMAHPARRSKRLGFPHFLHLRRVAELEGSSALPANSSAAIPHSEEESPDTSFKRSHRRSLHRLLHSNRLAELEASTDVLPVYSRTDTEQKDIVLRPPLPPKDTDIKASLSVPQIATRSITPVELDASEPEQLASNSPDGARSNRSPIQSIAELVASSSSYTAPTDVAAQRQRKRNAASVSEELSTTVAESRTNSKTGTPVPPTPDTLEFLDLASTESEHSDEEDDLKIDTAHIGKSANLQSQPQEETPVDPSLTAEIISAAVEAYRTSPRRAEPEYANADVPRKNVRQDFSPIHELDATDSAIKRHTKRQSCHSTARRSETQKRRPDFVTFKKQMSEAERRAKMIARRRKSRRRLTPKSF